MLKALLAVLRDRPVVTSMTVGAIVAGISAVALGAEASKAFTVIGGAGGGALIARTMGVLLAAGGLIALAGAVRFGTLVELLGTALVSAGALIYGGGVLIGLHKGGLLAGPLALSLSVGAALRVMLLSDAGRPPSRPRA